MRTSEFLLPLFVILLGMVALWFVLIKLLHTRLERNHREKYEAMGQPSLVLRNNFATVAATLAFILKREHRSLSDTYLSRLSDFMLGFLAAYLLLFLTLLALAP
jgi:hypothetical protein